MLRKSAWATFAGRGTNGRKGSARGSRAEEGAELGGLEMEQPGLWGDAARPVGQPVGPPRETEADLKMGPQATSGPVKTHSLLCPCVFPQRHSVTLRHIPELNFLPFDSRRHSSTPPTPCKTRLWSQALPHLLLTSVTCPFMSTVSRASCPVTLIKPSSPSL